VIAIRRRQALKVFAGMMLCPLCAATGNASEGHWGYEGETGPDKWGGLDAADAPCSAGGQQSPINIMGAINARQPILKVGWSKRPDTIVNNAIPSSLTSPRAIHSAWATAALR